MARPSTRRCASMCWSTPGSADPGLPHPDLSRGCTTRRPRGDRPGPFRVQAPTAPSLATPAVRFSTSSLPQPPRVIPAAAQRRAGISRARLPTPGSVPAAEIPDNRYAVSGTSTIAGAVCKGIRESRRRNQPARRIARPTASVFSTPSASSVAPSPLPSSCLRVLRGETGVGTPDEESPAGAGLSGGATAAPISRSRRSPSTRCTADGPR